MSTPAPELTSLGEVLARVGVAAPPTSPGSCLLTVVMRTQGRRLPCLDEALQSLAEQTDRDFEVVLVRHRAEAEMVPLVDDVVAGQPDWLRERIRVLDLDTGARGAPLNLGFDAAAGSYIVILDDDDLALPDWVATFRSLHDQAPGRALRAVALRQDVEAVTEGGQTRAVSVGERVEHWPATFQLLDHLMMNGTPPMTIAFPRAVFHDLGERFDEELDTTEDWDFLLRVVTLVGVAQTPEPTSIYRWWVNSESSRHLHDEAHWQHNHNLVQRRLDARVLLLPHGSVQRLQELVELPRITLGEVAAERDRLARRVDQLEARLATVQQKLRKQRKNVRRLRAGRRSAAEPRAATEPKSSRWGRLRS